MNTKETPAASASRHTPGFPLGYCGDKPLTPDVIKEYNDSHYFRANSYERAVTDDGHGVICNAVTMPLECGCKSIGNGTLQFPITVKLCPAHAGMADPATEIGELRREHARLAEFSGQATAEIAALRQALHKMAQLNESNPAVFQQRIQRMIAAALAGLAVQS